MSEASRDFTQTQYEEAYQAASNLRTLFDTTPNSYIETSAGPVFISHEKWIDMLFSFAPHGIYEVLGSMWDGQKNPYIPVYLLSPEEVREVQKTDGQSQTPEYFNKATVLKEGNELPSLRTLRPYKNIVVYALERAAGIAIMSERSIDIPPAATITLGETASYYTFGHHGGNIIMQDLYKNALNVNSDNPLPAEISDNDARHYFDLKENDMVPDFIIREMIREIKNLLPEAEPEFKLLSQDRYAMKYSLCIMLDVPAHLQQELMKKMLWMMPHYLSLCILPK